MEGGRDNGYVLDILGKVAKLQGLLLILRDAECVALCGGSGYDDFGERTARILPEMLSSYKWTDEEST
jgi:hypothetical protein